MSRIIHQQATIECNPEQAFEMFAGSTHVATWLGDRADIEPKVGGKYEVFWNYESGTNGTRGCRITDLAPGQFIAFDWKGPGQFNNSMNVADPLTHVVVFFTPVSNDATEVHLIHSGWGSTPEWEEARRWFVEAWGLAFGHLAKYVSKVPALA